MNILSLGTPLFSTCWRNAGHRVVVAADVAMSPHEDNLAFDFFDHPESCAGRLASIIDKYSPDIIFQGDHSTPIIHCGLEAIPIPKVWYSIDTHLHHAWHRHYAALFDRVFCAQKSMVARMSSYQQATEWLPPFCQRSSTFMPWQERQHDVAFVGTLDPFRNPARVCFFDKLRERKIRIYATTGDYQPVYGSSRIVVNQSVDDDLNLRFFEATGCGALLITDRLSYSLADLLEEGRDFLAYEHGNDGECAEKITWALAHPGEAESIARSGHARIVTSHLEQHRAMVVAQKMSSIVEHRTASDMDDDTRSAHLAWAYDYCSRLALPPRLTTFFSDGCEPLIAQGRMSIEGRPWTLLVSAGQAMKKGNAPVANALLSQIIASPDDPDFGSRYYRLKIESLVSMGNGGEAKALMEKARREFPDHPEIRELAKVVRYHL
jgi:hypothetical protein